MPETLPIPVALSDPVSVARAVPHLVAMMPELCVVLISVADTRPLMTTVLDLASSGRITYLHRAVETLQVRAPEPAGLYAVIYPDPDHVDPEGEDLAHPEVANELVRAAGANHMPVLDVLMVHGGRVWSYRCSDEACCPRLGAVIGRTLYPVAAGQ